MEKVFKQCYFCEGWFPSDQVEEVNLERHPSSIYEKEYICKGCTNTKKPGRFDKLIELASKALNNPGNFNEIELSDGDLKVHLVRFTPIPCYSSPPLPAVWQGSWRY
jgi:hypothetical protein